MPQVSWAREGRGDLGFFFRKGFACLRRWGRRVALQGSLLIWLPSNGRPTKLRVSAKHKSLWNEEKITPKRERRHEGEVSAPPGRASPKQGKGKVTGKGLRGQSSFRA